MEPAVSNGKGIYGGDGSPAVKDAATGIGAVRDIRATPLREVASFHIGRPENRAVLNWRRRRSEGCELVVESAENFCRKGSANPGSKGHDQGYQQQSQQGQRDWKGCKTFFRGFGRVDRLRRVLSNWRDQFIHKVAPGGLGRRRFRSRFVLSRTHSPGSLWAI